MKSSDRTAGRAEADAALATIDRALERGELDQGATGRERELERLSLLLRDGAPQPSPDFAAELDRRVEAGFARDGERVKRPQRAAGPRPRPESLSLFGRRAVGAFAVMLAALVVGAGVFAAVGGLSGGSGGSDAAGGSGVSALSDRGSSAGDLEPAQPTTAPEVDDTGSPRSVAPPSGGTDGFAPKERERRIERSAELTLAAPEERMDRVAESVVAVTDRHRGYVVTSSTFSTEDGEAQGSFDLRVPVDELQGTLSDLAALGTVRSQAQSGDDLTEPVATSADRLDGARAERRSVLRRLGDADSDREARALRERLRLVSAEIRGLRDELAALRERTDYARISVTLTDESSDASTREPDSTAAAFEDALGSLVAVFNFLVRAAGALLPLFLLAAAAWFVLRAVRRRRRESVLG